MWTIPFGGWKTGPIPPVRRPTSTRRARLRCIRSPGEALLAALGRRLGRSGPALRRRPAGPAAREAAQGSVRRGPGRTPGRGVALALGHGRRAGRRAGRAGRPGPAGRHAGAFGHRALGGAARGRPGRRGGAGRRRPSRPARPGRLATRPSAAPGVALAGLISASHEVGTVQPVAAAAEACAEAGVPLFVDAAQSIGRVPVPPGWSLLTASAHKWGGPPGVGVLVVRKGVRWLSPYPGDDLYRPRLPGALDLPAVVAAAA